MPSRAPSVGLSFFISGLWLPNAQHQRWEPAAADARIVTDLNGWLASAACYCWALEGQYVSAYSTSQTPHQLASWTCEAVGEPFSKSARLCFIP